MRLMLDFIYACRLLKKSPGFTALSILVLAGGLAVSLFTFGFLYTFTSKPLPLPEQGTLFRTSLFWHSEAFGERRYLPAYEAAKIRSEASVFAEHGIWQNKTVNLSKGENSRITSAVRTSANIFAVSRTQPLLGRTLEETDSKEGQPPVAVISYRLWQSQFAGASDIIGQSVYINDVRTEIIGVMPDGYRFPISHDLWLPIPNHILNPQVSDREMVEMFVRLKAGVTEAQAISQVQEIAKSSFNHRASLWPGVELISAHVGEYQQFDVSPEMKMFCHALNLIAFFILLLAAINVGNLLFARAIQRNKESAIRTALGAPQWRLISQLMWEGMIITVAGTVIAVLLVGWLLDLVHIYFHSLMSDELAFWYVWELDSTTIVSAAAFAAATIVVACFLPALKAARQDFNTVLRDGTRGAQSKSIGKLSRFLVTMQISAISIIMVLGAVISTKIHHLTNMQLGYDVSGIFFSIVDLPDYRYPQRQDRTLAFDKLQRNLADSNAFAGAAVRFDFRKQAVAINGIEYNSDADKPKVQVYSLIGTPEFMGPKLVAGRHLDSRDSEGRAMTAVVSQSMAKRYWPDDSPVDKRIEIKIEESKHWFTVVGVVSDTSNNPFEKIDVSDEVYLSGYQFPAQRGTVFFKRGSPSVIVEDTFFQAMNSIDSQLDILTIEDWELEVAAIAKMTVTFRNTILVSGLFSLILAMSGIYGLTSYSVAKRSQEVGIRRALGATDRRILSLFVSQGSRQLIIGLAVGIIFSGLILFAIASIIKLSAVVYSLIYLSVFLSLSSIVMVAIVVPAKRAVNLQPAEALRCE